MRKAVIAIGVIALLALGTAAYAHMNGYGGGYGMGYGGGYGMMGPGYGYGMMGPGYGYGMMGPGYGMMGPGYGPMWGANDEETTKFLDETVDLRRQLHDKVFDLREAYRAGDKDKAEALEKEVESIRDKIAEKGGFEKGARTGAGRGFGPRAAGYGYGYCNGPYGR